MQQKTPMEQLLSTEVSRKEFILLMATGIVSILGISQILHFITGKKVGSNLKWRFTQGYGGGEYGK